MKQKSRRPEALARALDAIDDETCARLDAELADERASRVGERPEMPLRDDGPDPLGIDWAWAGPEPKPKDVVTPLPATAAFPTSTSGRSRIQTTAYLGGAALAASLLIGLGILIGMQRNVGRELAFAARVTAREDPARGAGVPEITIENQTDRRAFITVVGLVPGKRPAVFYRESGQFVTADPRQARVVRNLPDTFDGARVALVVLTATPAGEAVQGAMPEEAIPERADRVKDALKNSLEGLGYRGVAVEMVPLPLPSR